MFDSQKLVDDIVGHLKTTVSKERVESVFVAAGATQLEAQDFRWALIDLGCQITEFEAEQAWAHLRADWRQIVAKM